MHSNKKIITVYTPTFNRAYLLPRLYDSLCCQTSLDFEWLVIDDGSSDNTKELIESWIAEHKITILYAFKENGGMHTGHNLAYQLIDTELNICIDSDDYMPPNAIFNIINKWRLVDKVDKIAGIIGLDADNDGNVIGTTIPSNLIKGSLNSLYSEHRVTGDKKLIIRTDVVKQYPAYPEYKGEKLVPLGLLYLMIGSDYNFIYSNEVYCIVEYQPEGSSSLILKQYKQSPLGFAYSRKIKIAYFIGFTKRFKEYIHLVSSSIFAKKPSLLYNEVNPILSLLAIPFGILLHLYILSKINNS